MTCPHSVVEKDPDTGETYCIKCGDVVEAGEGWNDE